MKLPTKSNDWFTPTLYSDSRHTEYRYDDFRQEIVEQLHAALRIDRGTNIALNGDFFVENIDVLMERHEYEALSERVREDTSAVIASASRGGPGPPKNPAMFPLLTFHATSDASKLNSIRRNGYLVPGQQHPTHGWRLSMHTGNLFGDGIYSSPHFRTAHWYGFLDSNQRIQLFVNILLSGRVKVVTANKWFPDNFERHLKQQQQREKQSQKQKPLNWDFVIPTLKIDAGCYEDSVGSYDTLRDERMEVWVTSTSKRITPVVLLSLQLRRSTTSPLSSMYRSMPFPYEQNLDQDCYVPVQHFADDIFLIHGTVLRIGAKDGAVAVTDSPPHKATAPRHQYLFCIDSSILKDTRHVDAINTYINSLLQTSSGDSDTALMHVAVYGQVTAMKSFWQVTTINQFISYAHQMNGATAASVTASSLCDSLRQLLQHISRHNDNDAFNNILHLLLGPSDVTPHSLKTLTDEFAAYLKVKRLVVKLLFLGADASLVEDALQFKATLQNVHFYESFSHTIDGGVRNVVKAGDCQSMVQQLSDAFDVIADEALQMYNAFESLCDTSQMHCSIPYPLGAAGEGFLLSLESQHAPVWDATIPRVAAANGIQRLMLYKGTIPEYLKINGCYYRTTLARNIEEVHATALNEAVQYYSDDFTNVVCHLFIPLLARFRSYALRYPDRCVCHQERISRICDVLIEALQFDIDEDINKRYSGNNQILATNINKRRNQLTASQRLSLKYFLQKLLSDITAFSHVTFTGKWFQKLMSMRYAKAIISKRVKTKFTIDNVNIPLKYGEKFTDPVDALPGSERIGYLIRVRRSAAAEVEPWQLQVELVSTECAKLGEIFQLNENGVKLYDGEGRSVTDILLHDTDTVLSTGRFDDISRLYHGYIFTRVPYLYISSQPVALLVSCWICCIERAFRLVFDEHITQRPHDRNAVHNELQLASSLYRRVQSTMQHSSQNQMRTWLRTVIDEHSIESIGKYFTDYCDISSLCKVLAVMTLPDAKELMLQNNASSSYKYSHFCMAMLAEGVMRSCRAKLRACRSTADQLIMQLLNLHPEKTNLSTWKFDAMRAIRISSKMIFHPFTNCSAFAIVATLAYLECIHLKNNSVEDIAESFSSGKISMKEFLHNHQHGLRSDASDHIEKDRPRLVQIALYMQGMRYAKASLREEIQFVDPHKIKSEIIKEYVDLVSKQQEIRHTLSAARKERQLALKLEAQRMIRYHTTPRLFTIQQVEQMNYGLKQEVPYVLQNNGLLLHHCCYPTCPQYLQCFATAADIKAMQDKPRHLWTRHGLMRHFKYDVLADNYVPSFHLNAKAAAVRSDGDFKKFCTLMERSYPKKSNSMSENFWKISDIEMHLKDAWAAYH